MQQQFLENSAEAVSCMSSKTVIFKVILTIFFVTLKFLASNDRMEMNISGKESTHKKKIVYRPRFGPGICRIHYQTQPNQA